MDLCIADVSNFVVAIVQVTVPDTSFLEFGRGDNLRRFYHEHRKKMQTTILTALKRCTRRNKNKPRLILYPELSVPDECEWEFVKKAVIERIYIIAGFEYTKNCENVAKVFTPHSLVFNEMKRVKSDYDSPDLKTSDTITVFQNSGIGDFAVLICKDLMDLDLRNSLRGLVDFVVIVSYNPGHDKFLNIAQTLCMDNFCFVALVNTNEFGDSAVIQPHREFKSQIVLRIVSNFLKPIQIKKTVVTIEERRKALSDSRQTQFGDHSQYSIRNLPPDSVKKSKSDIQLQKEHFGSLFVGVAIRRLQPLLGRGVNWKGLVEEIRTLIYIDILTRKTEWVSSRDVSHFSLVSKRKFYGLLAHFSEIGYISEKRGRLRLTNAGHNYIYKRVSEIKESAKRIFDSYLGLYPSIRQLDLKWTEDEVISMIKGSNMLIAHIKIVAKRFNISEERLHSDIEALLQFETGGIVSCN